MQEAVHRLIEEDEGDLESLRVRLQRADAEIDRGEGQEFNEQTTKDLARGIRERGIRRLAELQKSGPAVLEVDAPPLHCGAKRAGRP